jgi:spermidine synthase
VFRELSPGIPGDVAVIGLGTGATAAYGVPGERWTFFEIDPAVERIARDSAYFTYLHDSRADIRVVLGDGRLSLARAPDHAFRLIILDAFSSDAIPVHLLTRQALDLYFSKLMPGGVLVFHLSNRFLDLEPVLARLAIDARSVARIRRFASPSAVLRGEGVDASTWAVVARDSAALGALNADPRWRAPAGAARSGLWTDDFSNVFRLVTIQWRR